MFYCVLVSWISGKWTKREKSGQLLGVLRRGEGTPRRSEELHCGMPERRIFPPSGSQRQSHYSQHGNAVFLFRFVFLLFRKLVYWTNEDPLSV